MVLYKWTPPEGFPPAMFPLGDIHVTPGVRDTISEQDICNAIGRHVTGEWGDISETDAILNDHALIEGYRLFSAYHDEHNHAFWIITEPDRHETQVLLPGEY
jgi:hypothetical protein